MKQGLPVQSIRITEKERINLVFSNRVDNKTE